MGAMISSLFPSLDCLAQVLMITVGDLPGDTGLGSHDP